MKSYSKNLGKTAINCEDEHNNSKEYKKGSIVYKIINSIVNSFISRKDVPRKISLDDKEYWQPISLTIEYV